MIGKSRSSPDESVELIKDWKRRQSGCARKTGAVLKQLEKIPAAKLNAAAEEAHEGVFSKLNCLDCANCCSSIPPIINETDARRIAAALRMNVGAFMAQYVVFDEDDDMVINASPCPFLGSDNYCSIYDVRPRACRQYPHTDSRQFSSSMRLHQPNASYCPAVFHILEEMERQLL